MTSRESDLAEYIAYHAEAMTPEEIYTLICAVARRPSAQIMDRSARTIRPVVKQQGGNRLITFLSWVLALFALYTILWYGVYFAFDKDLENEVRLAYLDFRGEGLDGKAEKITWKDGEITFLSHALCTPTFKAYAASGALQLPPSEWAKENASRLLLSERAGCVKGNQARTFEGRWKDSPWAVLVIPKVENPDETKSTDWDFVWVDTAFWGMTGEQLKLSNIRDLAKTNETQSSTPLPTAFVAPRSVPDVPDAPPRVQQEPNAQAAPAAPIVVAPALPTAAPAPVVVPAVPVPTVAPVQAAPVRIAEPTAEMRVLQTAAVIIQARITPTQGPIVCRMCHSRP